MQTFVIFTPIMNIREIFEKSLSGLSKEVWIISLLMLVNRAGLMVVPFLTIYLTDSLSFTLNQAGTAGFCFGLGSVLSSYAGGKLTDIFGYANVMKFSLLSGGMAFWALLFFTDFYGFCIVIFLTAFLADLLRPAVMSSITLFSKEENQTRALSLLRIAINLGISIGPIVGGLMITFLGYDWLFILNGGTAVVTFFMFLYFNRIMKVNRKTNNLKSHKNKDRFPIFDRGYLWLLLILFLMFTAFIQIIFLVPVFFKEVYFLSEIQVGTFFTINGLLIVVFEMPIVYYFETRKMFSKPIIAGSTLMIIAFLALLLPIEFSEIFWIVPFIIYTLAISIGEILNLPFLGSLALARTTKDNSGSYMGLFALVTSCAFTVAPIIGTRIVSNYGFSQLWLLCIVFLLISNILYSKMRNKFLINEDYK